MKLIPTELTIYLILRLMRFFDKHKKQTAVFDTSKINNILVISNTAIGDTLFSTPAIKAIRERYQDAKIIACFSVKNMELFDNNPHIDGIIPYYGGYKKFIKTIRSFRKHHFDLVLILHGNEPQATPLAYFSKAPFIFKVPRTKKYAFLLNNDTDGFGDKSPWQHHAIDVRMKTISFANCSYKSKEMEIVLKDEAISVVDNMLEQMGTVKDKTMLVGLQCGAANKYKIWPKENFILLGRRIIELNPQKIRIILIGSKKEKKYCKQIADTIGENAVSLAGKLSLSEIAALIKRFHFLVTNDTGPLHMAVALKTKTISLFCPTNDWGVGPIYDLPLHSVISAKRPCDPCVTKKCKIPFCMSSICVDEVFLKCHYRVSNPYR